MITKSKEKGQRAYTQETPRWREFFDSLAGRLTDKEVLFVRDIQIIAEQARLAVPMTPSAARTSLQSWRRRSILLYLEVDVDWGRLYHKPLCFDRQIAASELRLDEAITRNMNEVPPYPAAFQVRVDELVQHMQASHKSRTITS